MFEGITGPSETGRAIQGSPSLDADAVIADAKKPPRASAHSGILLLVSLTAFALAEGGRQSVPGLLLLMAVLSIHEGGHALGMILFGYRDVRVFFVPFLGAVAGGRKIDAPAWQRGIVLLLGPLPGIFLSFLLLSAPAVGLARVFAVQLLLVNGFNLLPFYPLDGGGFVQLLFASRPRLQAATSTVGMTALALVSCYLHLWILLAVSVFFLAGTGLRFRL